MPIDPSIPLGIQAPQSGLASLAAPLQTAQGLLSLRQNSMQLNANQAISQAYQQSVDPATGQVDFNKLQSLAAQNGAGAFLPQFMGQIAQQRNSQLQYDTGKLDLALKQQQAIRGMIGSLAIDPQLGKTDLSSQIAGQIANAAINGILPIDQATREMQSIPGDPASQASWVQNHLINSLSGEAKMQALMPKQVDVGNQIVNINPLTGQPVAPALGKTLSPGEASQNVTIVNPDGSKSVITKAQQLAQQGAAGAGGYTGRYPSAQGGVAGQGLQTEQSPSQQAAQAKQGGDSAALLSADAARVNDSASRIYQLQQGVQNLETADTGPGSAWINTVKSFLQAHSGDTLSKLLPGDPNKIQSYDEANKYLTQYAMNQASSFGGHTDNQLATTLTASPNTSISKLAAQDLARAAIGLERMKQAQVQAFQQSGQGAEKYQQFTTQWNKQADPRVFIWDDLPQDKQQAMYNKMTPAQRETFRTKYGNAVQNGWIGGGQG